MSYEQADIQTYSWINATFGATSVTNYIVGPKGKVGFVREIEVDVATSLVGTTTVPEIDLGVSSGDYTYGRYRLGSTAILGYGVGPHSASQEAITGNPPRALADYAGHVVLDGGPLTSAGIAGGSYGTQVPSGRIPASGWSVVNAISGTSGVVRLYLNPNGINAAQPAKDIKVGQVVSVQGILGATGASNGLFTVSAVDPLFQYIELSGTTFGGTYTSGGQVFVAVIVTSLAGTGGTPAGGGTVRVKVQWLGAETP